MLTATVVFAPRVSQPKVTWFSFSLTAIFFLVSLLETAKLIWTKLCEIIHCRFWKLMSSQPKKRTTNSSRANSPLHLPFREVPQASHPEFTSISSEISLKSQYYSEQILGQGTVVITYPSPYEKLTYKIFCMVLSETMAYFSEIFFPCDLHSFSLLAIKPLKQWCQSQWFRQGHYFLTAYSSLDL